MKEKIYAVMTILFIIGALIFAGYSDTHYDVIGQVYSVEDNEVTLIDGAAYLWGVTDRPDLHEGDTVKIYFDNNCTDYTREDDIITKVKVLP